MSFADLLKTSLKFVDVYCEAKKQEIRQGRVPKKEVERDIKFRSIKTNKIRYTVKSNQI